MKVIAKHGAGYDSIDTKAAADHGIRVVFAPTANSMSVAEQATAIIINTARGTIIDQEALIEAIRNDEIAGAGLDVTDPEPAPPSKPNRLLV